MHVLTMFESEGFFVIPDEQTQTLLAYRAKHLGQILKACVRYVVKPGKVLLIHTLQVESFVLEIDALGIITHPDPASRGVSGYVIHSGAERIHIAGGSAKVDVPDGVEPEGV